MFDGEVRLLIGCWARPLIGRVQVFLADSAPFLHQVPVTVGGTVLVGDHLA